MSNIIPSGLRNNVHDILVEEDQHGTVKQYPNGINGAVVVDKYCKAPRPMVGQGDLGRVTDDGRVICPCGKEMRLRTVSSSNVNKVSSFNRPKRNGIWNSYCHCGHINGKYRLYPEKQYFECSLYSGDLGKMAYMRQRSGQYCYTTLEAHEGRPIGIPCNAATKIYRLHLHDKMAQMWGRNKNKAYHHLGKMLQMSAKDCHVARFDRLTCYRAMELIDCWRILKEIIHGSVEKNDLPLDLRFLVIQYCCID